MHDWRKQFAASKRLNILRLSFLCEGLYPKGDEWFDMAGPNLYFDDLLTGTEISEGPLEVAITELERRQEMGISEAGVINHCNFPG